MVTKFFYVSVFQFTFFLSLLLIGCNQNKVLDEEKFIKVYTDIIIATDTAFINSKSNEKIINQVLIRNDVTIGDYKMTIQHYNQDPEKWEQFFSKAIAYLELKRKNSLK